MTAADWIDQQSFGAVLEYADLEDAYRAGAQRERTIIAAAMRDANGTLGLAPGVSVTAEWLQEAMEQFASTLSKPRSSA